MTNDSKSIGYDVVIDSGADFCIFDAQIGEYLGFDIKSGMEIDFVGIDGSKSSKAYIHNITMRVNEQDYNTDVGFSYDIAAHDFGVVGLRGFFDLFSVKFDTKKEIIQLVAY